MRRLVEWDEQRLISGLWWSRAVGGCVLQWSGLCRLRRRHAPRFCRYDRYVMHTYVTLKCCYSPSVSVSILGFWCHAILHMCPNVPQKSKIKSGTLYSSLDFSASFHPSEFKVNIISPLCRDARLPPFAYGFPEKPQATTKIPIDPRILQEASWHTYSNSCEPVICHLPSLSISLSKLHIKLSVVFALTTGLLSLFHPFTTHWEASLCFCPWNWISPRSWGS